MSSPPGILRIRYGDNDFGRPFLSAAVAFKDEIQGGYPVKELYDRYRHYRNADLTLDVIQECIVLAAYGFYIAHHGYRWHQLDNSYGRRINAEEHMKTITDRNMLKYLSGAKVEEIQQHKNEWENGEVVYINFHTGEVFSQ